jgi:hypothetical protein
MHGVEIRAPGWARTGVLAAAPEGRGEHPVADYFSVRTLRRVLRTMIPPTAMAAEATAISADRSAPVKARPVDGAVVTTVEVKVAARAEQAETAVSPPPVAVRLPVVE